MGIKTLFLPSTTVPPSLSSFKPSLSFPNTTKISLRHFHKQLPSTSRSTQKIPRTINPLFSSTSRSTQKIPRTINPLFSSTSRSTQKIPRTINPLFSSTSRSTQKIPRTINPLFSSALNSSYSDPSQPNPPNPISLKTLFNPSFYLSLPITPLDICKWAAILSISIAATKKTLNLLVNPFFWMYFSWTWLFWPWIFAVVLAIYGVYCIRKHSLQKANVVEQLAIVTSAITWLTLVPPAHFNGYLEGWPVVFFFAYHYFFFFDSSIRKRLYGDLHPRPHDSRWDISLPNSARLLFAAAVMVAHWLAAAEGPELHLIPGGWANFGIWVLIAVAQFMKYHSTLYLMKYSEKVVVPTSVVQFGPYRWVRHPIYASTMLLFAVYFVALRAPLSLLFVVGICLAYYSRKAKLEEDLMVETFRESYTAYMSKVRYKFIPLVY